MAIGKKTGGRDFKKGVSGNPKGKTPLPNEIKEIKKLTQAQVILFLGKYSFMKESEAKELAKSPETDLLEKMFANAFLRGLKDFKVLEFILNRAIGKPTEQYEIKNQVMPDIIERPNGTIVELGVIRENA